MGQELKRSLSLFDVVALGINGVIGTGIFLLPGKATGMMGPASVLTLIFAAVLCFLIALCFAEVGSHFRGTGGAYLYALRTFGDTTGFFVGWMVLMVTISSWAAMVNGLATASSAYIPELEDGLWRNVAMVGFMTFLTGINLLGAKMGARVSNLFTVAKLLPLVLFVGVGLAHLDTGNFTPFAPEGFGNNFFEATLLILYAYVGFEALVVPAGEMKNPRRAVPLALIAVLTVAAVVYIGVLIVSTGTLPGLAGHGSPVVAASENFMPGLGASVIAAGIIISMVGVNSAQVLVGPRRVFALSENGHMPRVLSLVSRRGAPHVALITLLVISAPLAVLVGDFTTLAMVSVVARFAQYITTCFAALLQQSRRRASGEEHEGFKLPWGPAIPIAALALCAVLLIKSAQSDIEPFKYGGLALLAGVPVYAAIVYVRRLRAMERTHIGGDRDPDKEVFPILKAYDWVAKEFSLCEPFDGSDKPPVPVVAFGYDAGDHYYFVPNGGQETQSPEDIKREALANIEKYPCTWEEINEHVLTASGTDFSAEKILSKSFLATAQKQLKAERILVGIPRRRVIYAANADAPEAELRKFHKVFLETYNDDSFGNAQITNMLFRYQDGELVGAQIVE